MIVSDTAKLDLTTIGNSLFDYDLSWLKSEFKSTLAFYSKEHSTVQAIAFVLSQLGELPEDYQYWIFKANNKYATNYELGQWLFKQLKKHKILVLESLDRELVCKVKLVQKQGIKAILVSEVDKPFKSDSKARIMADYEIENYLSQFMLSPDWMQKEYVK